MKKYIESKYIDITIDEYDKYEPVLDNEEQPMQFNSVSEAKQYVVDNIDENATEDAYRYIWASVDSNDNLVEMQSGIHICNILHHEVTMKPWCTVEDNDFMVIASEPR